MVEDHPTGDWDEDFDVSQEVMIPQFLGSQGIKKHNDPYFRSRNPCLHYHIWDTVEDTESVFVTLGVHENPSSLASQLSLNMLEMWMCLVFQTLTPLHLYEYLPNHIGKLWSGNHLNVALPLWQGFTGNEKAVKDAAGGRIAFQQFLASSDPTIRAWAEHARDAFNDIRNSPDPILRDYYKKLYLERRIRAQKTLEDKKAENVKQYLIGAETQVRISHSDLKDEDMVFLIQPAD
ncbi:hypothetical protein FE257_002728 [Aspergillus nanangensis]|uniref:Uncharacterized protein n=1 Tax=Aspergillus nanangensis TaxID=2582783 RepID=A0AAD4CCM2_ASPNN|nr:hypothetical protein FE257_002728 [Aspergillus nanangensis]